MLSKSDFEEILAEVQFNDWAFFVGTDWSARSPVHVITRCYLQVRAKDTYNVSGEPMEWGGRKWFLSPHMTKSEVVATAFKAVLTAVEHETREQFVYRGVSIFDPHYDVDRLWELRQQPGCLSERA